MPFQWGQTRIDILHHLEKNLAFILIWQNNFQCDCISPRPSTNFKNKYGELLSWVCDFRFFVMNNCMSRCFARSMYLFDLKLLLPKTPRKKTANIVYLEKLKNMQSHDRELQKFAAKTTENAELTAFVMGLKAKKLHVDVNKSHV